MSRLEFDPRGDSPTLTALKNLTALPRAYRITNEAIEEALRRYPNTGTSGTELDAFRHAYWSLRLSRELGVNVAKQFTDAHEREQDNPVGDMLMDLFNNHQGRALAGKFPDGEAAQVIEKAIKDGKLQLHPFKIEKQGQ